MNELDSSTRDKILNTAYSTFLEFGYKKTTMSEIAHRVGNVSRTTLNHHFRTKENLYNESLKFIIKELIPSAIKILNSNIPLKKKLKVFVENYIKVLDKNPLLLLFIINETSEKGQGFLFDLKKELNFNLENFYKQINEECGKGTIAEVEPVQFFTHIISLCAFPIVGKPFIQLITDIPANEYENFLENRKTEVVRLLYNGLTG